MIQVPRDQHQWGAVGISRDKETGGGQRVLGGPGGSWKCTGVSSLLGGGAE